MNFLALNGSAINANVRREFTLEARSAPYTLASEMTAFVDLGALITDDFEGYDAEIQTPTGTFKVPITAWQGTLSNDGTRFLQVTIRSETAEDFALHQTATEITVYKIARIGEEELREPLMSDPIDTVQTYDSASGYTTILRATSFSGTFGEVENVPSVALKNIRRISRNNQAINVRCGVEFTAAPNYLYDANGTIFTADFVNFYGTTSDVYMDIGTRGS